MTGVCCVFATNRCNGATVDERVAYFTNPSYPFEDSGPTSCMLKIKPQPDTCWVRFDLVDLKMHSDANGNCPMDSASVLNSKGGDGGRFCGVKSNYAYLAEAPKMDELLSLSIVVQSPNYKWNIRVQQIPCSKVRAVLLYSHK